ncbi:hypothetical protein PTTG_08497 [Puccinia triticina 1-1 BBBD Race 1]|uniref:WD_REPEATS_REGION domain-containing protein n=1 Tax=Puccinia triticina (isolate 1-1 / race 1 (BBBD)) TaxID=630390 RepID=A0A180GU52_PUCT1|nr:hypothetical protein PTTG_08497 [Puccinia triticina 1-1 BBBD Race 1]
MRRRPPARKHRGVSEYPPPDCASATADEGEATLKLEVQPKIRLRNKPDSNPTLFIVFPTPTSTKPGQTHIITDRIKPQTVPDQRLRQPPLVTTSNTRRATETLSKYQVNAVYSRSALKVLKTSPILPPSSFLIAQFHRLAARLNQAWQGFVLVCETLVAWNGSLTLLPRLPPKTLSLTPRSRRLSKYLFYLAIGRLDGCVTIVDFETKRTIKFLMGHVKPITSLDWSCNSRYLLSSSRDWNVIIWDLNSGEREQTVQFNAPVTSAQFHPINRKLLVVTLQSQEEVIFVDLRSQGGRWELDARQSHQSTNPDENPSTHKSPEKDQASSGKRASRRKRQAATVARFNPSGDLIYVRTSQGTLHIFDCRTKVDTIVCTPWQGCGFGSEYVVAGAGHKDSHQIFIGDCSSGTLTKILAGPKDPSEAFDWHPT